MTRLQAVEDKKLTRERYKLTRAQKNDKDTKLQGYRLIRTEKDKDTD